MGPLRREAFDECGAACACAAHPQYCANRVVQRGVAAQLQVFHSGRPHDPRAWRVLTREALPRGSFVCIYAGEVLEGGSECERRRYALHGSSYCVNAVDCSTTAMTGQGVEYTCLDAAVRGNVGRFINHSCDANLLTQQVHVPHEVGGSGVWPCVAFFCARDVEANEELTWDYRGPAPAAAALAAATAEAEAEAGAPTSVSAEVCDSSKAAAVPGYNPLLDGPVAMEPPRKRSRAAAVGVGTQECECLCGATRCCGVLPSA